MPLKNDVLLRAAKGQSVPHVPVWMMRQAGRYLPEYRRIREGISFFDTCRRPDLVAEITIQPIRRFPVDAAIVFSDILVVPQAMGMDVRMVKGTGPVLPDPLRSSADVSRLRHPEVQAELGYVFEGIRETCRQLEDAVPLIGFAGAPWTLMAYMVEGGGSKSFDTARSWLYAHPASAERLLNLLADVLIDYLLGQIHAGARMIQIFDSWAGLLSADVYERFALPPIRRISAALKDAFPDVPRAIFARGAHHALEALSASDFDVISLDWTMDARQSRRRCGEHITLQGNLDPAVLYATPEVIDEHVQIMLQRFGTDRYIANLGHGMLPDHDPDHAAAFVAAVHKHSMTTV